MSVILKQQTALHDCLQYPDQPTWWGEQPPAHKAGSGELAPTMEESAEGRPAAPLFPVCRRQAARGIYASEAHPMAANPALNASMNGTAKVLC